MNSRDRIIKLLTQHNELTAKSLSTHLQLSRQRTHRLLKELIQSGAITKVGSPPLVIYSLNDNAEVANIKSNPVVNELLDERFILVDAMGHLYTGLEAFSKWCENRSLSIEKTLVEYQKTIRKYDNYKGKHGLISGIQKLENTKGLSVCLDDQFYADFYAIERFGKTKLGQLLHFGKMSQHVGLIKKIVTLTKSTLLNLIDELNIDAVGYIPPTLKRDIQIMKVLEHEYNLSKPIINLQKLKGEIVIPQKALSKLSDRITNARNSILIHDNRIFENVLLIDDALGSGATINETACKLKSLGRAKKVFGYVITGSYKGFEVLSEA